MKCVTQPLLAFGLGLALSACATPEPTPAPAIQSVTFVSTTGTVAPDYWRGTTLTVNNTLDTTLVTKGAYGDKVLENKTGKITQAQFDQLVTALNAADFTHAKSTTLNPPPVGGGNSSLTVKTTSGEFAFQGSSTAQFPAKIGDIFNQREQYQPH